MTGKEQTIDFEGLAEQFANEIRAGANPDISDYAELHPEHAETIHRLFPILEMMERNGSPADDLSESGLMQAELQQLKSTPPLRRLGDYRIVREIGRGGMGIVFEAEQESLGRMVALKLLPNSAQFDDRRRQRFQQEALASAQLHHTNIVPVFGVGTHDETAYFVMQYIDGQPMDNVIDELSRIRSHESGRPNDSTKAGARADVSTIATMIRDRDVSERPPSHQAEPQGSADSSAVGSQNHSTASASTIANVGVYWRNIARIGIQVANALDHAHSKKILHRDIKPSNLMLDESGDVWVTDFGLAKYFESPDLTQTGEVLGTLRYMSPEQLNGYADERSDLFSLGLTLYELAGLKPAYDAVDRNQLMKQVIEAAPKPLKTLNRRIPRDLETIIHKCIALDPAKRYGTATDLANDLQRFVAGQPVRARRISVLERTVKWCRRRPAVACLVAALAVSLLAGVAGIMWQWQKTVDALELANSNLNQANRQTEVAQKHFRQARESVERFFTIVSQQRLLQEPGFQSLRKELLQEALDYHQQFVAQYRDDEEARFELAQSLYFTTEIEGSISPNPHLAADLDEPIAILRDLIETDESDPDVHLFLGRCLALKSNLLRRVDLNQSLENLQKSIDTLEEFRDGHGEHPVAATNLARNYQMMGLTYETMDRAEGRTDRALNYYTNAYQIRNQIYLDSPDNLENAIDLGLIHRDLGITYRRMNDFDQTLEHYDRAIEILQPIVDENPDNMMARDALGSVANSIGYYWGRGRTQQDYQQALEYYALARTQYEALSSENPLMIQFQDGLARAELNIGSVYQVMNLRDEALAARRKAVKIRERLCNLAPDAFHIRSSLAQAQDGLGSALRDLDRIDEAIAMHRQALENHIQVVTADQQQSILRLRLVDGLSQLARAQSAGDRFADAIATMESVDEYVNERDSKPYFTKGRELALIASKIGRLESPTPELLTLKSNCMQASREAFQTAAERGYDVYRWAQRDTPLQNFSEYPECDEIVTWINREFGPE